MNKESGARVNIDKPPPGNSDYRLVFITGSVRAVSVAFKLINAQSISYFKQDSKDQIICKLIIPREVVSYIIGKGGGVIRRLEAVSRAHIQLDPDGLGQFGGYGRMISVTTTASGCPNAVYQIIHHVSLRLISSRLQSMLLRHNFVS